MSEENVEIVRALIDAFNRGDWDSALRDMAPGFEFDNSRAAAPDRGVYGRDQMRGHFVRMADPWESLWIEPHEFIAAGAYVVVPWTLHAVGRDGIKVRARPTFTFTIRDGALERMCMYQEREEALEAAGLAE
jgi:ketosteroid isomerase-like protein